MHVGRNQIIERLGRAVTGLGLGFALLIGQSAVALDLSWHPRVRLGMRGSDNVRWSSQDEEAAFGFDTGGGLGLKAQTANGISTINPSFNFRRFAIGESLDADEYGVRSQHQYALSERLQASLQADYYRDSTLSSEITDAGRQNDIANRDTVTVQPGLSYLLDESTALNVGYLYSDVSFDATANQGLVNYKFQQWTVGGSHNFTKRLQTFVSAFITDFDVSDVGSETWTYGGQFGVNYEWSNSVAATMSIGYQTSSIDFLESVLVSIPGPPPQTIGLLIPAHSSSGGPIATFGLTKNFEHTKAEFNYARRVSPSIRGAQSLEDDISVTADHELSRTWMLGFRGGYNMRTAQAEEIGGTTTDLNRDQASLSASATYRATKEISLRTEYRFTRNSLSQTSDLVYVNSLFLSMTYNGKPHLYSGL